jgi:hypothetical protein
MEASRLVAFAQKALDEHWGYVLSGQGETYTIELAEEWARTRSTYGTRKYFTQDCARWFGRHVTDCSGLIVAAIRTVNPLYKDRVADTFRSQFVESGKIKTIPEIPGLAVWRPGHIGVYIGGGYAIEARGYKYGVVLTEVKKRTWTRWGKLRDIKYLGGEIMINKGDHGPAVEAWQMALLSLGIDLPGYGADGWYGNETVNGTKAFQEIKGLPQTGSVDDDTAGAMFIELLGRGEDSARVSELEKKIADGRVAVGRAQEELAKAFK